MRYLFLVICGIWSAMVQAQENTVWLQDVQIAGSYLQFSQSAYYSQLDSSIQARFQTSDLGALLQASTGLYLRQYGAEGQLTSVSFRGTTPNHTQVSWQGVDINSQTLGQMDFSGIPSFLFSGIELYHGPSSALYGSGAIGGVVALQSKIPQTTGVSVTQQFGSFGNIFTGLKGNWVSKKWAVQVAAVRDHIHNDFDVHFRKETYAQNNAANDLKAITANVVRRIPDGKLNLAFWYNHHHRQIQPIMGDRANTDQLEDENLRLILSYEKAASMLYYKFFSAYISDQQRYNINAEYNIQRWIESAELEFTHWRKWNVRSGIKYTLALPEMDSYAKHSQLHLADWFGLSSFRFHRSVINFQVRIPYMSLSDQLLPVPSLGLKSKIIEGDNLSLSLKTQVARSFRFPTLNDLFWQPGGNRNLKPEDGINAEFGFGMNIRKFELQSQIYRSWITDMIVWMPSGAFWSPQNVTSVNILGNESSIAFHQSWQKIGLRLSVNYAYNHSVSDADKQLPYVPAHKATGLVEVTSHGWGLFVQSDFTGLRYTEASNTNSLPGYKVFSTGLEKSFALDRHQFQLSFQIKNLLNTQYQNYELRAVPGRNYFVKLNYQIIKNEKR